MGTSENSLWDRAIVTEDAYMEVFLQLVVDEIDKMESSPEWLRSAREVWAIHANEELGYGCMPPLNQHVIDDERRCVVLLMAERALAHLNSLGDPIPVQVLNNLHSGRSRFLEDLPSEGFVAVAEAFVGMLRAATLDGIPLEPDLGDSSEICFWNCRMHANDIVMRVWLHFVASQFVEFNTENEWFRSVREYWLSVAHAKESPGLILHLDKHICDDRRRQFVLDVSELAIESLRGIGNPLPHGVLNACLGGRGPVLCRDIRIDIFISTANSFMAMVRDAHLGELDNESDGGDGGLCLRETQKYNV